MNGFSGGQAGAARAGAITAVSPVEPARNAFGIGDLAGKLARASSAAMLIYGTSAGLSYCAQFAVARTIGAGGYGVYTYVLTWLTVLAYFGALGFDIALLRFVPAYLTTGAIGQLRGVIHYASRRVAIVGGGIALIGIGIVLVRSDGSSPELTETFVIGFPLVPILALLWTRAAVVRGFGGVFLALAPDRLLRDGILLTSVLAASLWIGVRAPGAMMGTVLGGATGLALVSFAMHRLKPRGMRDVAPVYDTPTWRRTIPPLVVIETAEALVNRTGIVLLGWMLDTKSAGIYALAFNLAFAMTLPRTAVNTLLGPAISGLFTRNDHAALRLIVARAGLWTLLSSVGLALPLLVFAEPVLALFGREFVAGAPILRILLIGHVAAAAAGSQLQLMTMTGHERSASLLLVGSAGANVIIGIALIPLFGPVGAAIAATIAMIGWNAAMGFSIFRYLRMYPGVLARFPAGSRQHRRKRVAERVISC